MSDPWSHYSSSEQKSVEIVSAALEARDALVRDSDVPAPSRSQIGFSDLYAFVTNTDFIPEQNFLDAIESDPKMGETLDVLVARGAICRFGFARAASGGDIDHREERDFSIHLHASAAVATRVIVLIELRDGTTAVPTVLFARHSEGRLYKHVLPAPDSGQIQFMVESDAGILQALRDPNARVTLR